MPDILHGEVEHVKHMDVLCPVLLVHHQGKELDSPDLCFCGQKGKGLLLNSPETPTCKHSELENNSNTKK